MYDTTLKANSMKIQLQYVNTKNLEALKNCKVTSPLRTLQSPHLVINIDFLLKCSTSVRKMQTLMKKGLWPLMVNSNETQTALQMASIPGFGTHANCIRVAVLVRHMQFILWPEFEISELGKKQKKKTQRTHFPKIGKIGNSKERKLEIFNNHHYIIGIGISHLAVSKCNE